MITSLHSQDINDILNIIGSNYGECLYLYLDLIKYGTDNPNIKVWADKNDDTISSVLLKYYTGMHIYCPKNDLNVDNLAKLIKDESPSIICAKKSIIEQLETNLSNDGYKSEYGAIRRLTAIEKCDESGIIKNPTPEDFNKITELLLSDDDIGGSYTFKTMHDPIVERYNEKYGRNYIIKDGDKVIAHAGTGAENEKLGILNYVITDPNYRRKGLASKLCTSVCYDLVKEGKDVFLINYSNESTALYDKLGFKLYCDWGKLYLDNN